MIAEQTAIESQPDHIGGNMTTESERIAQLEKLIYTLRREGSEARKQAVKEHNAFLEMEKLHNACLDSKRIAVAAARQATREAGELRVEVHELRERIKTLESDRNILESKFAIVKANKRSPMARVWKSYATRARQALKHVRESASIRVVDPIRAPLAAETVKPTPVEKQAPLISTAEIVDIYKHSGLSGQRLAKMLGISKTHFFRLKNGHREATPEQAQKLLALREKQSSKQSVSIADAFANASHPVDTAGRYWARAIHIDGPKLRKLIQDTGESMIAFGKLANSPPSTIHKAIKDGRIKIPLAQSIASVLNDASWIIQNAPKKAAPKPPPIPKPKLDETDIAGKRIGSKLRKLRKAAELSAGQMAEYLETHLTNYYRYEAGSRKIQPATAEALGSLFGCDPNLFLAS